MTILLLSTRRDGRSLGQMAREELGPLGGYAALIGTLLIMILLIAVLGLVVVNAMKNSPWSTATVFATVPVAILVGLHMRRLRPGRILEGSALGVALVLLAVWGGGWVDTHPLLRGLFDWSSLPLAGFVIGYGWIAAILPVWLLLAPRDYLSTFLKLGTVALLAIAILLLHPQIRMPALTSVRRRPRAALRRQGIPLRLHHHRLRRGLGIPCAGRERHDAQAHRQRGGCAPHRLWQHDARVVRRHHGHHRRDAARSRRVLRHQHRRGCRGRHRGGGGAHHLELGISRHRAADADAGASDGRGHTVRADGRRTLAGSRDGAAYSATPSDGGCSAFGTTSPSCSRRCSS